MWHLIGWFNWTYCISSGLVAVLALTRCAVGWTYSWLNLSNIVVTMVAGSLTVVGHTDGTAGLVLVGSRTSVLVSQHKRIATSVLLQRCTSGHGSLVLVGSRTSVLVSQHKRIATSVPLQRCTSGHGSLVLPGFYPPSSYRCGFGGRGGHLDMGVRRVGHHDYIGGGVGVLLDVRLSKYFNAGVFGVILLVTVTAESRDHPRAS